MKKEIKALIGFKENISEEQVEDILGENLNDSTLNRPKKIQRTRNQRLGRGASNPVGRPIKEKQKFSFTHEQLADGLASALEQIVDDWRQVNEDKAEGRNDKRKGIEEERARAERIRESTGQARVLIRNLDSAEPSSIINHQQPRPRLPISRRPTNRRPAKFRRLENGGAQPALETLPASLISTPIPSAVPTEDESSYIPRSQIPAPVPMMASLWRELIKDQNERDEEARENDKEYREKIMLLASNMDSVLTDIRNLLQIIASNTKTSEDDRA